MHNLYRFFQLTAMAGIVWLVLAAPLIIYGSIENATWQLQQVVEALL